MKNDKKNKNKNNKKKHEPAQSLTAEQERL